jgi:FAD-linked oxidoreductase
VPARWTNWAGNHTCAPEGVERPRSEQELAEVVRGAASSGRRVRPVGTGHSFTDAACTDGVMVDTRWLDRVVAVDSTSGRVRVGGGIRLHELGERLAALGLALENQGDIDAQSLAGAIATGTHGTGLRFGNLSSRVVGVRLVTTTGEVVEVTDDSDPEALAAARVSLGALGIASAVTVQCLPLYTLRRRDEPRPLGETLARLDELAESNDHFELFVFPYTRTALTRATERSGREPEPGGRWRSWIEEDLVENGALSLACRVGRRANRLVPSLNRRLAALIGPGEKVDRAHRVYATKRRVRFTEMEYACPRAQAREAVERILALVERRRLPIAFPLEVRFSAGDDALLSPAHGRETCYLAVHQYVGMEYESYFRAVEAIMDDYDGRPHWGKLHYQSAATLAARYPEWERFQGVRNRLDPEGVFVNDYTRRVLGRVGTA